MHENLLISIINYMQSEPTYKAFKSLSKQKQYDEVQQKKQEAPSATPHLPPPAFPQTNYLKLQSVQDKKAINLATYRYASQGPSKALIVFFHNLGYHIGLAGLLAKNLSEKGFTFVGYDQRGHGKSQGERGYLDDADAIMKDAKNFILLNMKETPNVPVFLMGHGMGGLLSLVFSQQFKDIKFAGVILLAPSLKKPANSKVMSAISDFALKLMPNKAGIFSLVFQNVCRNPTASDYLKKDSQIYHGKVQVGSLVQMMSIMQKNEQKKWSSMQTPPLVIVQGQCDKVSDPINSINFYESIKTKDKQFWWYDKMWNNVFCQQQINQISQRICAWISTKL